jgi:hypothetical protein
MKWEVDAETIRDCPGDRTEVEWRIAVREKQAELQGPSTTCQACGQEIAKSHKYIVTETEEWLPASADLPRGRWALSAHLPTLAAAREMQRFMGPRATVWIQTARKNNSATYRQLEKEKN